MRLDLLLLRLRFSRSRSLARQWIECGHIRCNRLRITKASHAVTSGDVLTLPIGKHVTVIEILALPERRGPASEAQQHYRVLDDGGLIALAGRQRASRPSIEGLSAP